MKNTIIFFVFISSLSVFGTQEVTTQVSREDVIRGADNKSTSFEKGVAQTEMFEDVLQRADDDLKQLKNEPHDVYIQEQALSTYNLVKEMLGEKPVQSWQDIDELWIKQQQYKSFKQRQEEKFLQDSYPINSVRMWALLIRLQYHLDQLKSEPNSAYNQREALFTYNYMLERAGEKLVNSWEEINLEKAESLTPSFLRSFFEPVFQLDFWTSPEGSIVLATYLAVIAFYVYQRQMAAGMPGLIGAIPPGAVPVFAPAAAAA